MQDKQVWEYTDDEKRIITSIVIKGREKQKKNVKFAIIGIDSFYKLFNAEEIAVMKRWLAIDPKSIGYKLPYLGASESPADIVAITDQIFDIDGKKQAIPCQYLPNEVHEAYKSLNKSMQEDIGKSLLVLFGHRSQARQVFMFFDILQRKYDFDFNKTIQRVCFPDYSEHVCTQRQAIDFKSKNGLVSDEFDTTDEYVWLKQNANIFGFYESYPKNNQLGMMYEPWHWHYEKSESKGSGFYLER